MKPETYISLFILGCLVLLVASNLDGCRVTVQPALINIQRKKVDPPSHRLLIFGFDSCPACKTLHRTTREMSRDGWRVGSDPTDDIEHIDIYGRDEKVSQYKHGPSYPCLILVDKAGREVGRHVGAMGADKLAEWIRSKR